MAPRILKNNKTKNISINTDDNSNKSETNGDDLSIKSKKNLSKRRSYTFAEKQKIRVEKFIKRSNM